MKTMVRKSYGIKIIKIRLRNLDNIFLDFETQNYHLISARRPARVLIKKKEKKEHVI